MPGAYSSKRIFLFDLDGTLVDSTTAHTRAFIDALAPAHLKIAESFEYPPFAGRPTREVFVALGLSNEPELTDLVYRKQQNYRAALERGDITIFAGVVSLLDRLQKCGGRLFVVTGASRISTERVLELTKLARFFEGVTAAEDVCSGKPAPDPYLHTLARYGLGKEDCLAIEDGESGIISAQKAGVEAVLIHTDLEIPGVRNVGDFETFAALLFP
jgi:HAD superfamily hydrolase (TIGR01509 family)